MDMNTGVSVVSCMSFPGHFRGTTVPGKATQQKPRDTREMKPSTPRPSGVIEIDVGVGQVVRGSTKNGPKKYRMPVGFSLKIKLPCQVLCKSLGVSGR